MDIRNYDDFCTALLKSGFSLGGGNAKGIFALIPYDWREQDFLDTPVKWHTGDRDTDPWEWRMRVLEERNDIAYAKLFFGVSGYITREWYPWFLAARRGDGSFEDAELGHTAQRIYSVIKSGGRVPYHELKTLGGFGREETADFEKTVVMLQKRMFITVCGRAQKHNSKGEGYGWNSTVFCTVEDFWHGELAPAPVSKEEAAQHISERVYELNPKADPKVVKKFIFA